MGFAICRLVDYLLPGFSSVGGVVGCGVVSCVAHLLTDWQETARALTAPHRPLDSALGARNPNQHITNTTEKTRPILWLFVNELSPIGQNMGESRFRDGAV